MLKKYRTSEVAEMMGIHPNTVRFYEEWGLITKPVREANGYRVFNNLHLYQIQVVRLGFEIEILQNGLRKRIVEMIKTCAKCDFDGAIRQTEEYLIQLEKERVGAEEAIKIVQDMLQGEIHENQLFLKRKEVSDYLDISVDALRNWEMNGLITIKRKQNGYRIYTDADIRQLKIIRVLRCANYSLEAIRRMIQQLSENPKADIQEILDTPEQNDDTISACDRLLLSLSKAEINVREIMTILKEMKALYCEEQKMLEI